MPLRLVSLLTLGLLSSFIYLVIFLANFFAGIDIPLVTMIGIIIAFNVLLWLISPFFSDLMYRWFYKVQWKTLDELAIESPKTVELIKKVCTDYRIKTPKLGMIPDENPTAFTYGSGKWNARIVISHGIITYLDDEERAAVYAHELGHIKNNDFIVMTIASTLLQILYEIYVVLGKSKRWSNDKGKWALAIIALISYVLYFVGQYILLYLSRVREYYADEFSGQHTDPNKLSDALIKIAYGILVTPAQNRLVESTKFIGIASEATSKWLGMLYYNVGKDDSNELIEKSFLYDLKNPWALISELSSTHPLTGKRIGRLMTLTTTPKYDINAIEQKYPVDKSRLYSGFGTDILFLVLTRILPYLFAIIGVVVFINNENVLFYLIGSGVVGAWVATLIRTFWAYPNGEAKETTVLELMADVYASPVKGAKVKLTGKVIGKWEPWYVFAEDVMFQDSTGFLYLDYQSKIPLIGNLIFSLTKVKKFIGQSVNTTGWFFRGVSHYSVVETLDTTDGSIKAKGGVKFWGVVMGMAMIIIPFWIQFFLSIQ